MSLASHIYLKVSSHTRLLISPFLPQGQFSVLTCASIKIKMARQFFIRSQQTPPSERDVYLCYSNEHYDSICSMKSSEECIGGITFNITQDDVNAFVAIGVSFYVSDPMDVVNGGKLYFVPPKNFSTADSPFTQPQDTTSGLNNPSSDQYCTTFVPNAETLENSVRDFNTDIQLAETEYEEGEDDPNEDKVYDMFADLDLSQNVQDEFHFAENYSCHEDAVLDNSGDEQENVMPLKP